MLLALYLVVCAFSFGLVNLGPLFSIESPWGSFNGNDALLLTLLVASVPCYLAQRRKTEMVWLRRMESVWMLFIVLLAVQSFRSPADSLTERLVHVRFVQGYLLFFPSIAVLTSGERVRRIAIAGMSFAIVGTVLTVLQSLHGLDNLFDSPYYSIGAWPGNKMMVGDIARVNLPISNWVAFVLLVLLPLSLLRFRPWQLALGSFLFLTILLNFARSLWLGMGAAFLTELLLLIWTRALRPGAAIRLLLVPLGGLAVLAAAPYVGLEGLSQALLERLNEGVLFYSTDSGTWRDRLYVAAAAMQLWESNPVWGVGTAYNLVFGTWIDLGPPMVLVSIGVVGLAIEVFLFAVCVSAGITALRQGLARGSLMLMLIGVALPAEVVLMLVYQQWLTPDCFAILGLASALAVTGHSIIRAAESTTAASLMSPSCYVSHRAR